MPSIWLHAVSVGEIASAEPLLAELRRVLPDAQLYVSTATIAGKRAAHTKLRSHVDGIFYAPFDFASCVRRVLRTIRPALLIVLETEIWPNLYYEAHRSGCQLAIVNARISDRTWPRYRRFRWFFQPVLSIARWIVPQSNADRERYIELGVPSIAEPLNLKYDAAQSVAPLAINRYGAKHIIIAASTVGPNEKGSLHKHDVDEDDVVLQAFRQVVEDVPDTLLILAPRQPSRFAEVASKLSRLGLPFARRSDPSFNHEFRAPGVLLLDTIGELARLYSQSDVAFVGGSLAPRGGHNILEPAAAGVPVIVGPHMHNFRSIANDFIERGALLQVANATELAREWTRILRDPERARDLSDRSRNLVKEKQGAAASLAPNLANLFLRAETRPPRSCVTSALLDALSVLWVKGGQRKRRSTQARALPRPVISIGNITLGGTGKTPLTDYLAAELRKRGHAPAILTRGYKRISQERLLVFPRGASVPVFHTGDEAQIYLRSGFAHIGIGANRREAGELLLQHLPQTDVFLLDDGFQQATLERNLDIVVLDALDPFGGGRVFPSGRLREPVSALERADAFVITRAEDDLRFKSLRDRLEELHPGIPVFRARLVRVDWAQSLHGKRVAAFCGLGNPQNFWNTLAAEGAEVVYRWSFDDHHRYSFQQIQRLADEAIAHGADLLATTEKDSFNLPPDVPAALRSLPLIPLKIRMEIEDQSGFLSLLESIICS